MRQSQRKEPDERVMGAVARAARALDELSSAASERGLDLANMPNGPRDVEGFVQALHDTESLARAGYFAACPHEAALYENALEWAASTFALVRRMLQGAGEAGAARIEA